MGSESGGLSGGGGVEGGGWSDGESGLIEGVNSVGVGVPLDLLAAVQVAPVGWMVWVDVEEAELLGGARVKVVWRELWVAMAL